MATDLQQPVFVIGTHRSGTTLLGRALGHHPEVAYWEEPRHVWARGHNFRPDDSLTAADATAKVSARVRRRFQRYLSSSGHSRLVEKTPSNCLRLEFIREIFPDALFVHILRDGRAVVSSTEVKTRTDKLDPYNYARRLLGTPIWEWPALLPRAWHTAARRMRGREMAFWGPQPPGWRQWVREDERLVVLAKQWRHTLEPVLEFRDRMPASQWLDVRYEQLVDDPAGHARELQRFGHLPRSQAFEEHLVSVCRADRVDAWRSRLSGESLAGLRPILEPPLARLGYEW